MNCGCPQQSNRFAICKLPQTQWHCVKIATDIDGSEIRNLHMRRFAVRLRTPAAAAEVLDARHDKMRLTARGDRVSSFIQNQFEKNVITTSVDYVFNWARKSA